jgi:hypothetical protein
MGALRRCETVPAIVRAACSGNFFIVESESILMVSGFFVTRSLTIS